MGLPDAGISLLRHHHHDLDTTRSCLDFANPCKSSAAVVYLLLTKRCDADPFVAFTLRGRTKEKALAALRAERGGALPAPGVPTIPEPESPVMPFVPLSETVAEFWRARSPLEDLPAGVTAVALPDALIRALKEPAFWSGPGRLRDRLSAVYETVARDLDSMNVAFTRWLDATAFIDDRTSMSLRGPVTRPSRVTIPLSMPG